MAAADFLGCNQPQSTMKCPHCGSGVSMYSSSIRRRSHGKCPTCGAPVRTNVRHKMVLLISVGVAMVPAIVAPKVPPFYGSLLVAVSCFLTAGVGIVALTKFELIAD